MNFIGYGLDTMCPDHSLFTIAKKYNIFQNSLAERIAKERAEQEAREREREERSLARWQVSRGKKKSRDEREDR